MTATQCRARALVYSGRPDPEWQVDDEKREALEHLWNELPPSTSASPAAPPLGYRGLSLDCSADRHWLAYGGVVTFQAGARPPQYRRDERRRFERALADTAPPDVLTPQLRRMLHM